MNIYSAISSNKWKTWFIMLFFVLIISTLTFVFSKAFDFGLSFVGIALIISAVMSVGSFYYSDKLVLATLKARRIDLKDNPELFRVVENLSIGAGLPMPKIYIIDDPSPNAFATGRDPKHAVVCATTGLLNLLNKTELEGVIAHELSHVKNYDIRLMTVVAILVGSIAIMADIFLRSMWFGDRDSDRKGSAGAIFLIIGIILAILSPLAATLIQLAVSRKREFLADASGALLTRYPQGLASALEKLEKDKQPLRSANHATAHLFIEDPFQKESLKGFLSSLFNTHPPIHERIRILKSM
ncbi:MAG: M48 family metalloprotease [Candidatus Levybacteria bacterium]|nr:M48 family metalloprotease [Candidatus Levybacteria bacterium]